MFGGELLDALGDLVVALGEDDGRGHGFGVVFQRDGDVGWIGDVYVGLERPLLIIQVVGAVVGDPIQLGSR